MEYLTFDTPMLVSAIIMVLTFLGIFTEGLHGFHRTKFAILGAVVMMIAGQYYGFYSPQQGLESIDWNVVLLLAAMMTIVAIMIPTGGFQLIAFKVAHYSRGNQFLLMVLLGTAVTLISLLLDNVTTVVIFGPLIILIARTLHVNPIPYLLAAALLSDTGGIATLVGDPPNLMIGSAAHIDFNTFLFHMSGIVFAAWITTILALKYLFRKEFSIIPKPGDFGDREPLREPGTWRAALISLGVVVVLFMMHRELEWEAWMVATVGLTLLLFLAPHIDLDGTFAKVEITLLLFFIALFVLIGGVEQSHFLEYIGTFIYPFVKEDLLTSAILLMWVAALLSAMIDNIPFTAAMIPILLGLETQGINITPLWWSLAIGVGLGGNGTHLGSTANVYIVTISERLAKEQNDPSLAITPGVWFRRGTPVMLLTLVVASLLMVLFFDFFAQPFH